ncbi:hypothetical protein ABMA27_002991 [Loxostege sticticalis]|uniref:Endonuclease n=1 Tax=Loxostege sticticalis TaxID=481309 RepID=A0ABR3HRL7_LOXSC
MAWNLLCERYNNSRLLVNNHVQALFNVEPVSKESSSSLRHLIDTINKNIRALKTLNEPTEHWDTLLVYMMSNKLDAITSRNWEEHRSTLSKSPSLSQFCEFINNKADLLETIEEKSNAIKSSKLETKPRSFIVATNNNNNQSDNLNQNKQYNNKQNLNEKIKCPLCSNNHLLYTCETFRNLPVEIRISKVKEFKLCFNCLRPGHLTNRCRLSRCKYCKTKHNTLLHVDQPMPTSYQDPMPSSSSVALPTDISGGASLPTCTPDNVVLSSDTSIHHATSSHILLSTALVRVVSDGKKFSARILLDNGSTANFITSSFCDRLRLPRRSASSTVTDASERAYGACVYVRSVNGQGSARVQLLVSKNRVAPIKPTTIPRLELCGALLGTRLCTKVMSSLTLPIHKCHFWCDSTIVLCWIGMSPNMLKPFVRHRVDEIQESTAGHTWSYVPSKDNPADLVSRGLKADLISECHLWWSGPQFLLENQLHWPKMPNDNNAKQDLPEIVSNHFTNHESKNNHIISFHQSHNNSSIKSLIHKYSHFNKLQRVMAYVQRFIYNLKNKQDKKVDSISNQELNHSFKTLIHHAQIEMFPFEYTILKSGKTLPRKNRLVSLSPFLDDNDVIRVGGRLDNSPYDYNVKHPILMCSKHHLTKLIFSKFHLDLLHAGPQLLLANIRQTYWPLGGRNLSKVTVRQCIKCFRYKCSNIQPIMGQLPTARTQLEFPFLNCSVDYAGPVFIADRKGRGCKLIKSYLCIFVCLAVKAVHIELATDLTKEAYMAALNRFVARRGKPQSILSDNGTNFVGASNELQKPLLESDVAHEVAQQGIEFTFSPPHSPHFNGIAEAAVRSTKHHLKRLLQLTHFTFEEMATCLAQIEAVLNSRPLIPLSSDPLDFSVLTPAHFLIGRPLMSVPHPQVTDINVTRLERYQRVEHIKQHFWDRYHLEYVSLLQQKTKWATSTDQQLSVGTLVLIRERGQPPLLWPLGRVTQIFPGSDGATRVAELKTKKGTVLRAFNNICPLPLA